MQVASKSKIFEQYSTKLDVILRLCQQADLYKLEWFGMFTNYRQVILDAFERQEQGEVVMLVAEVNHFPVGQLWIDLTKWLEKSIGVFWALRVLSPFQGMGVGSCLLALGEKILKDKGFAIAELGVEKDNLDAKRLYERAGYQTVRDNLEEWDFLTPNGEQVHEAAEEWIMHKRLSSHTL